jgi:outer membrane protein TolC
MVPGLLVAAALAACTAYSPLPLDKTPSLKTSLSQLRHAGPALPAVLGVDDISMLAVENDPDLVAARRRAHVAEAQVLAAGILPNPSVTGNYGFLLGGPGTVTSIAAGLSEDIKALVTLSSRRRAADAAAQQVNATIVWQEWQVIAKARLLAVDLVEGDETLALSRQTLDLLQGRLDRSRAALAQGDATLSMVAPDVVAVAGIRKQIDDLNRQQATRRHDLNALLDLSPGTAVPLARQLGLPEIDAARTHALLQTLADRRPDLVALQLGYRAQEAKLRGAILAEFPALALGVTGGRDNSDVRAIGPQITLDLPIFDRNQGNIAIERATREQLHAEFTARLAAAIGDIRAMMASQTLIEEQLAKARPQVDELAAIASRAGAAYAAGNLDERTYADLATAVLAKRQEIVALEQSLLDERVAIATLIGAGMPPVLLPPEEPGT